MSLCIIMNLAVACNYRCSAYDVNWQPMGSDAQLAAPDKAKHSCSSSASYSSIFM